MTVVLRSPVRPWWRWLYTAAALPPAGLLAHVVAGRVDSVPSALAGGVIAGAGIGLGQWLLLRRRGWVLATALGMGAGLTAGAALVGYRTDRPSLAVMGAITGLGIGLAQGRVMPDPRRSAAWALATAGLWALGWTVTASLGIDVDQQWTNFGAYGAISVALGQSTFVRKAVAS
jgi:uncharacterized membrane protein (UPF0136 family)